MDRQHHAMGATIFKLLTKIILKITIVTYPYAIQYLEVLLFTTTIQMSVCKLLYAKNTYL